MKQLGTLLVAEYSDLEHKSPTVAHLDTELRFGHSEPENDGPECSQAGPLADRFDNTILVSGVLLRCALLHKPTSLKKFKPTNVQPPLVSGHLSCGCRQSRSQSDRTSRVFDRLQWPGYLRRLSPVFKNAEAIEQGRTIRQGIIFFLLIAPTTKLIRHLQPEP